MSKKIRTKLAEALLLKPFEPGAIECEHGGYTEVHTADTAIFWKSHDGRLVDLGYDIETGKLVAVRVEGCVAKRAR